MQSQQQLERNLHSAQEQMAALHKMAEDARREAQSANMAAISAIERLGRMEVEFAALRGAVGFVNTQIASPGRVLKPHVHFNVDSSVPHASTTTRRPSIQQSSLAPHAGVGNFRHIMQVRECE